MSRLCKCVVDQFDSPFCPQCGGENRRPIVQLQKHCEHSLMVQRNGLDTVVEFEKSGHVGKGSIERKKAVIAKWESWCNALKKLIEQENAK